MGLETFFRKHLCVQSGSLSGQPDASNLAAGMASPANPPTAAPMPVGTTITAQKSPFLVAFGTDGYRFGGGLQLKGKEFTSLGSSSQVMIIICQFGALVSEETGVGTTFFMAGVVVVS